MTVLSEDESLADSYVTFAEALGRGVPEESPAMDAAERAYRALEQAIRHDDASRASRLVVAVLRRAPDERLGVYAAGLLEDLVRLRGAEVVEAIEAEAAADERFRWALGRIWIGAEDLPRAVLTRIVRASGDEIRPLGWPAAGPPRDAAT